MIRCYFPDKCIFICHDGIPRGPGDYLLQYTCSNYQNQLHILFLGIWILVIHGYFGIYIYICGDHLHFKKVICVGLMMIIKVSTSLVGIEYTN